MVICKAYKLRIYPDKNQQELIDKTLGSKRFIYNTFLDKMKESFRESGTILSSSSLFSYLRELKSIYPWLKDVDPKVLNLAIFDLSDNFKKNIQNIDQIQYKKKDFHETYKTNNFLNEYMGYTYDNIRVDFKNKEVTLPKLKKLKFRGYRKMDTLVGKVLSATISKEAQKYFISLLVEVPFYKPQITYQNMVGLDIGIKDFAVTSYGEKIAFKIKNYEKKLRGLQRGLARCQSRSKNSYKIKMKIERLYLKIKNSRKHLIHQIANKLLDENDLIAIETLDVKKMYQTHSIAQKLTNIPISDFFRVLKYKANWRGKKVVEIDQFFPSSQLCSRCNYQNKEVKDLKIRSWECPRCKTTWDRDINASINIMFEGLKKHFGFNAELSI